MDEERADKQAEDVADRAAAAEDADRAGLLRGLREGGYEERERGGDSERSGNARDGAEDDERDLGGEKACGERDDAEALDAGDERVLCNALVSNPTLHTT